VQLVGGERGIIYTARRLAVDPGGVVNEYVSGRTVVYTNPIAYLAVTFTAFALAFRMYGGSGSADDSVFWAAIALFLAVACSILFRSSGFNFAEHLIASLFIFAQAVAFVAVATVLAYVVPQAARLPLTYAALAAVLVYVLWSYTRVYGRHVTLAPARALVAVVAGLAFWAAALLTFVQMARK
jgi:hypothetical protein